MRVWRRAARRIGDDAGQVAGIEAIPFGILVLVVGVLFVANAWAVIDAKLAVDAAAREAARSYVEGWPNADRSWTDARQAAREATQAQGRDADGLAIEPPRLDPGYQRCARVTVVTRYHVPALTVPFVGGFGHGFTVTARHSELIDPYRNGGGSAGGCA